MKYTKFVEKDFTQSERQTLNLKIERELSNVNFPCQIKSISERKRDAQRWRDRDRKINTDSRINRQINRYTDGHKKKLAETEMKSEGERKMQTEKE